MLAAAGRQRVEVLGSMSLKVYFDFHCPNSYRFRRWVDLADLGIDVDWRGFLLIQAREERQGRRVFDHAEEHPPGLQALAAYYHLCQTDRVHADVFHRAVFEARHVQELDIDDPDVIVKIAVEHGVDSSGIGAAMDDTKVIRDVAAIHEDAVMAHGMSATPTLVGPDGQTLFVRLGAPPEDEPTAQRVVQEVVDIALAEPWIRELRRT